MRRSGLAVGTFVWVLALAPVVHAGPMIPPVSSPPAAASGSATAAAAAPAPTPTPGPAPAPQTAGSAALAPLPAPAPSPPPASTPVPVVAPTAAPSGIAVVAMPGATDAAWPLAQAVYSTPAIRPVAVDEVHARVLCGEAAPPASPGDVRDLAETVAAIRGEDAASRAILVDMAHRLNVRALAVVHVEAGKPVARVFVAETQSFDAASYGPDAARGGDLVGHDRLAVSRLRWSGGRVVAAPRSPRDACPRPRDPRGA